MIELGEGGKGSFSFSRKFIYFYFSKENIMRFIIILLIFCFQGSILNASSDSITGFEESGARVLLEPVGVDRIYEAMGLLQTTIDERKVEKKKKGRKHSYDFSTLAAEVACLYNNDPDLYDQIKEDFFNFIDDNKKLIIISERFFVQFKELVKETPAKKKGKKLSFTAKSVIPIKISSKKKYLVPEDDAFKGFIEDGLLKYTKLIYYNQIDAFNQKKYSKYISTFYDASDVKLFRDWRIRPEIRKYPEKIRLRFIMSSNVPYVSIKGVTNNTIFSEEE